MFAAKRLAAFAGSVPRFLLLLIAVFALSGCLGNTQPQPQPQPVVYKKREPVRDYDYPPSQPIAVEEEGSAPPPGPAEW